MQKKSNMILNHTFVLMVACFLVAGMCTAQERDNTSNAKPPTVDQPSYAVPEEKAERWEKIQKKVKQEHHVCAEHCGYESNCLEKCKKAFKSRMDREYQQLMYE